ncbi:MAG: hypothetical protein ACE5OZ_15925 [Candidatus Heimdallarchaeota archaeon]
MSPDNHHRIQQHLEVLFDFFKETSGANSESALDEIPKTWRGQLILKYLDPSGISWEKIQWIHPKDTTAVDSSWEYRFYPVEGVGEPEEEIAKTIQTFLQLLVLEGYPIMKLSAVMNLEEGPSELVGPRDV